MRVAGPAINGRLGSGLWFHFVHHDDSRPSGAQNLPLTIYGLHDRATVYQDGQYMGTVVRDQSCDPIILSISKTETRIDILVENIGRMNTSIPFRFERKGILDCVRLDCARLIIGRSEPCP
jgi:beta-galactosidase